MIAYTQCAVCIHRRARLPNFQAACDAFPTGIPEAWLRETIIHDQAAPGDGGIVFEADPIMWSVDRDGPFFDQPFYRERIAAREPRDDGA